MQLANDTAAPLAKDLPDEIRAEQVEKGKDRLYSKDNIKMTVVEERLGFTWSWNPSAQLEEGKNETDQASLDLADLYLMGACYGAEGYGKQERCRRSKHILNCHLGTKLGCLSIL